MSYPGGSYPVGGYAAAQAHSVYSSSTHNNNTHHMTSGGGGYPGYSPAPAQSTNSNRDIHSFQPQPPAAPAPVSKNPVFVPYVTEHFYEAGRCKALFIGINYKGEKNLELDGAANDCKIMLRTLEKIQFPIDECVVLTDTPEDFAPGFEKAVLPTRKNILFWLNWLVSGAEKGDCFFLQISGHAIRKKQAIPDGTEKDDCDSALVPIDHEVGGKRGENVILDDLLWDVISALPEGCRLTICVDTCNSGGIFDLPFTLQAGNLDYTGATSSTNLFVKGNNNQCRASVICFSGCEDGDSSADATDLTFGTSNKTGESAGAATCALTETLLSTSGLTYGQILAGMRRQLAARHLTQVPQLSSTRPVDLSKPFSLFGGFAAVSGYSSSSSSETIRTRALPISTADLNPLGVMGASVAVPAPPVVGGYPGASGGYPAGGYSSGVTTSYAPAPGSVYGGGGGYPGATQAVPFPVYPNQQQPQQQNFGYY